VFDENLARATLQMKGPDAAIPAHDRAGIRRKRKGNEGGGKTAIV
jgi:hypothetical protein